MSPEELQALNYLRTPQAIRERAGLMLELCREDRLDHFRLRPEQLEAVAEKVVVTTWAHYPDLQIPYHSRWRHFGVGGVDRAAQLQELTPAAERAERARIQFDLVITSVLLDAGAGPNWSFLEESSGRTFDRSEGLAVASFHAFLGGAFSSDPAQPLLADASGLSSLTPQVLGAAFQVSALNPLVGLAGRAGLLNRLGAALSSSPEHFGSESPRVGNLFDYLAARAEGNTLPATTVLEAVLAGLGSIWPGRVELGGVNLGDVWPHPALSGPQPGDDLVPFHKLSQWLTYSLVEPLEEAGIQVQDLDQLTGLAEYRNGGLLVDMGLLEPKHPEVVAVPHSPGSPLIVEWRALTLALLDEIAQQVRALLGQSAAQLPLAKVLEGGTWTAGREVARERRPDGSPPIRLESDGTVF